jgi:hypothetical protein
MSGLLADDAAQEHLEIHRCVGGHDGGRTPFAVADERQRGARRACAATWRSRRCRRAGGVRGGRARHRHPRAAAVVVLAPAGVAGHAQRHAAGVGGPHRVHPIDLARAAEVLDRISGAPGSHASTCGCARDRAADDRPGILDISCGRLERMRDFTAREARSRRSDTGTHADGGDPAARSPILTIHPRRSAGGARVSASRASVGAAPIRTRRSEGLGPSSQPSRAEAP